MASRLGRFVPAVRNGVSRGSTQSALRPFNGSGFPNPLNFIANEMRRMEQDMNRMQSMFFNDTNRSSFFRPFTSLFDNNFFSDLGNDISSGGDRSTGDISDYIVEDKDGKKKLQLEFDASGFQPEDIHISTRSGNRLEIHAKYQDESEGRRVYQEYTKVMTLPEGVDAKQITCHFDNNSLTIEAPYTPPANTDQQQKLGSTGGSSGPRKIDVKHLGDDGSHSVGSMSKFSGGHSGGALGGEHSTGEVEGGSRPMVGGNHDPNALNRDRFGAASGSSGSSTSGGGGTSGAQSQQNSTGSEQTARSAAAGGSR